MRIVFFGSPEFALPALKMLNEKHNVVLVVTQPDKPKGRGRKLEPTPVAKWCQENSIEYINPRAVKTLSFAEKIKNSDAHYGVVVAYGRILTKEVLGSPEFGCLNIHPSLLPAFRGPAPVNHALIQTEYNSGITIMQVSEEMDAGDIILQEKFDFSKFYSAGELLNRCAQRGAEMLLEVLESEEKSGIRLPRIAQDHSRASYAPILTTESAHIDWNNKADKVCGHIRGYDPKPGAWTVYKNQRIKLFGAQVSDISGRPGEILGFDGTGLIISCSEGSVIINEVQMPSKVRMPFKSALVGYSFETGTFMEVNI